MLKFLSVKNYAIIDDLSIDFGKGFNVFTGETGAGKSIIIGALTFLFRGRSDASIIKTGKDKAVIEGVFETDDKDVIDTLNDNDIDYDGELIIRRTISKEKGSSIKINGSSVTLSFLSALSDRLFDIHSQRDSIYLLDPKRQLNLIDRFAGTDMTSYKVKYDNFRKIQKEISDMESTELSDREIEFIRFDLQELESAGISIEEEDELAQKEKMYANFRLYTEIQQLIANLYDSDGGIKESLYELISRTDIQDEFIISKREAIDNIYYSLDDTIEQLKTYLSRLSDEPVDIDSIQERQYVYSKLKRKHKTDTEGLIRLKADLKSRIDLYSDRDQILAEMRNRLNTAYNELLEAAGELSSIRRKASDELQMKVHEHTSDLLLPNCRFEIELKPKEPSANGADDIEFMVSMNKGEVLKPLRNTASGGELSRLMLALKTVFASLNSVELMVFDEIDTGVSGKVAKAVGLKMSAIAKSVQVICITHLAPVAAFSDAHFFIYKEDDGEHSATKVKELNDENKITELALISSGSDDEKSRIAAAELYKEAQSLK